MQWKIFRRREINTEAVERYLALRSISDPAYRIHQLGGRSIRYTAAKHFHGTLLEIGCGEKTKSLLVGDLVSEYIGLDHEDTLHDKSNVDIFGTAYDIPVESESFDCVLCTAVLEHLEEPAAALKEAFRVLKPGGYALYTAPLFWHIHEEPRDFYRYTRYGFDHLFKSAGFEVVEIRALSGFITTFAAEWGYYLRRFRWGPFSLLVDALTVLCNISAQALDRGPLRDDRFTWMYLVLAKKPDAA